MITVFDWIRKLFKKQRKNPLDDAFKKIMELSPSPMCHVGLDVTFLRVNKEWEKLLGYSNEEFKKLHFRDITHPDDIAIDEQLVSVLLKGDRLTYQLKKRYIHRFGKVFWILLTVVLLRDRLGKPLYFVSQVIPIDEPKEGVWHD